MWDQVINVCFAGHWLRGLQAVHGHLLGGGGARGTLQTTLPLLRQEDADQDHQQRHRRQSHQGIDGPTPPHLPNSSGREHLGLLIISFCTCAFISIRYWRWWMQSGDFAAMMLRRNESRTSSMTSFPFRLDGSGHLLAGLIHSFLAYPQRQVIGWRILWRDSWEILERFLYLIWRLATDPHGSGWKHQLWYRNSKRQIQTPVLSIESL